MACDPADPEYGAGAGTSDRCHQKQVSDLLAGSDKVLALGDLQYEDATLGKFNEVYNPSWGRFKAITAPAIGNHEYGDPAGGAAGYFDYFNGVGNSSGPAGERSKAYYSFDLGAWHLVALNSNCGQVSCAAGDAQEQWLRGDLAAHPSNCTLAFWHHPLFTSESGSATTSVGPLWKALRENAVDVLLVGHAHNYERFARLDETGAANPAAGLRQFVVGTGGKNLRAFDASHASSEFRDASHFGVLRLSLHAGSYDWRFVTETGATTDSGSEACI